MRVRELSTTLLTWLKRSQNSATRFVRRTTRRFGCFHSSKEPFSPPRSLSLSLSLPFLTLPTLPFLPCLAFPFPFPLFLVFGSPFAVASCVVTIVMLLRNAYEPAITFRSRYILCDRKAA